MLAPIKSENIILYEAVKRHCYVILNPVKGIGEFHLCILVTFRNILVNDTVKITPYNYSSGFDIVQSICKLFWNPFDNFPFVGIGYIIQIPCPKYW